MTDEDLEFQISQYVDGTLSTSERHIVDDALVVNPAAQKILADYQKLNGQLLTMRRDPAVQWDQFAKTNFDSDRTGKSADHRRSNWF